MPITYTINTACNIITETWTGTVDAHTLGAYWKSYLKDPVVLGCRRTVVDMREATVAFTGNELFDLVRTIALPALGDRKWASALLVGGPVQFGTSRQYQAFADMYSTDSIFHDRDAAEAWLMGQAV